MIEEIRSRFVSACRAAEPCILAYIQAMPADVRERNPFLFVGVRHDVPAPPEAGVPEGTLGCAVDIDPVFAADIDAALETLLVDEAMRAKMRGHIAQQSSPLAIGRLPFVRVILYDSDGVGCALGRFEDDAMNEKREAN